MFQSGLNAQKGGVAILTSMGFSVFAIPLISRSLSLAQTTNIDARVKTDAMYEDYCGLAVMEFFNYMLEDVTRFEAWMLEHDPDDTGKATGTLDLKGVECGMTIAGQDPLVTDDLVGDPVGTIPLLGEGSYNQRKFQVFKTVELPEPFNAGDSVAYEIQIRNRTSNQATLSDIRDTLFDGFY